MAFVQTNFLAGEWSTFTYGRVDDPRYKSALARCLNYLPLEEGCLTRRPGTKFFGLTKNSGDASRLVPFTYSNIQAYVLEFGEHYFRILKNEALFVNPAKTVTDTSTANPAVAHVVGHGYSNGDSVLFSLRDFSNATNPGLFNGRQFPVTVVDVDHFSLGTNGAVLGSTTGGDVFRIVEVVSPYSSDQIFAAKYAQDLNKLYIFNVEVHPQIVTRTPLEIFTITPAVFTDGPYLDPTLTTTITPSGTTGSITITLSADDEVNDGAGWQSGDVGRLVRIQDSAANWTWLQITAVSTTLIATATVMGAALADTSARTGYRIGVYSDFAGWPSCGVFHEGRLWLAGAPGQPNRVDGSKSGLPLDFTPTAPDGTVANDNGIAVVFDSHDANPIVWLASDDHGLIAGTQSGTWNVRASTLDDPLTPTSVQARLVSEFACSDVLPQHLPSTLVFIEARQRKIYDFSYNVYYGNYHAENLTKMAQHLTASGAAEMVYQHNPLPTLWVRKIDGSLAGIYYDKATVGVTQTQFNAAWHQHVPGSNGTAVVESFAVVPTPDGLGEELYLSIRRFLNGSNVRTLERLTPLFDDTFTQEEAYFVDGGFSISITPIGETGGTWASTAVIPAYFYAIGETLDIMVNGYDMGSAVVDATGNIEIPIPAVYQDTDTALANVFIGYSYTSQGQLMRPEEGSQNGAAIGKKRRIDQYAVQQLRTLGMSFGTDFSNLTVQDLVLNDVGAADGSLIPLNSGMFTDSLNDDLTFEGQICWQQNRPYPGTVLSMTGFLQVQDK